MLAVKGVFKNGTVKLKENIHLKADTEVIIVFPDDSKKVVTKKEKFLKLAGIWKNKNKEEIQQFKEIIKEREKFGRRELSL